MRALVYHGSGIRSWEGAPDPELQADGDAIVRVDAVTICDTDLHILDGGIPEVSPGLVLGHEAVGTVEAVGRAVARVRPGDRVLISCITSCGTCPACHAGRFGRCRRGGWLLGHTIDGTQAERVRVPFADTSTYPVPTEVSDEEALMLADVMPISLEVGACHARVREGDVVAIVGAGPIGLAAILSARMNRPDLIVVVDLSDNRLDAAMRFGADVILNGGADETVATVRALTGGRGADIAVDAVGVPDTSRLATMLARPDGHIANIGMHGMPATFHLWELWDPHQRAVVERAHPHAPPQPEHAGAGHQLDTSRFVTHRFTLTEFEEAYDTLAHATETGAMKVVLTREAA
jgi:alcohol dehydrogenase